MQPLLQAVNLSKSFGTLSALEHVSLDVFPGEVVGLAGRSGSGKSALSMLLAGAYPPNEGAIFLEGKQLRLPFRARALGIETIHQKPDLADDLDVVSNIFLGHEIGWPAVFSWMRVPNRRKMEHEAARILAQLEVHIRSTHEKVANLSGEQRQMIAIARALTRPCLLLIIDDPILLLSYPCQQKLLSLIQSWRQQGTAVIFASNNVDHLLAVTDRIIVLRQGQQVAEYQSDETDREEILAASVGTTHRQELTPIIWALDSYYRARDQAEKLRHEQIQLERQLASPDSVKRQLLDQLSQQIAALDSANAASLAAQRRLLTELEQERKHLAREIHDEVIQDLLGVNYQLEELDGDGQHTTAVQQELTSIRDDVRVLVEDLRRICGDLRPPTIDSLGLGAAIQSYTRDWADRTGIPVLLDLDPALGRMPESIELPVFRIVQEGLRNVRKHADATATQVSVRHTSPRTLMVSIADNGRGLDPGFDLAQIPGDGHYGLLGISERVALLGGRLKLQNQVAGGLLLQVEIPHPRVTTSTPVDL